MHTFSEPDRTSITRYAARKGRLRHLGPDNADVCGGARTVDAIRRDSRAEDTSQPSTAWTENRVIALRSLKKGGVRPHE